MPIYEYDCPECGRFETIQKVDDKPLKECPNCKEHGKKSSVKKAVSAAAFHLKGTGWYKTDYAAKSSGNTAPAKKDPGTENKDSGKDTPAKTEGDKKDTKNDKPCGPSCACH